jgi:hypothetical protein
VRRAVVLRQVQEDEQLLLAQAELPSDGAAMAVRRELAPVERAQDRGRARRFVSGHRIT